MTAEFAYDGLGNRLAQTVEGVTTAYVLDVAGGLPQVIVETTGGQTIAYLPGLAQDQGTAWAYYLPDALGSVRQLANASAQVTLARSYEPFGGLLEQAGMGSSGFGFAGEQRDAITGLVFLRARYYEPALGRFVSQDPWPGTVSRPATLHGYQYVANNPILHSDPSGKDYVPEVDRYTCDDPHASGGYVYHYDQATGAWGPWPCIVNPANLTLNNNPYKYSHKVPIPVGAPVYPYPDRNGGPPGGETQTPLLPPYLPLSPPRATLPDYKLANELKGANGYLEGRVSVLVLAACVFDIQGEEIVYDFETLQRQKFTYTGESGFAFSLGSASETYYGGALWGFSEASNITQDYEGLFIGASLGGSAGLSVPILKALGLGEGGSVGMSLFSSPNLQVYGRAAYLTLGVSGGTGNLSGLLGILPDASAVATIYKPEGEKESYRGKELQMLRDLKSGDNSPLPFPLGLQMPFNNIYGDPLGFDIRDLGVAVGADTFTRKGIPVH